MPVNRLSWMVGGAQGSGVDSSTNIFTRACAHGGLHIFGQREYYSNIKGRHSYFQVNVAETPIRAPTDTVDLLTTFDAETIIRHAGEVVAGGGIIYDPGLGRIKVSEIPTLEPDEMAEMRRHLKEGWFEETVEGALEEAVRRGVRLYPVPYTEILVSQTQKLGESKLSLLMRMVNIMAVSASMALLSYDRDLLKNSIEGVFKGKQKVAEMNVIVSDATWEYVQQKFSDGFPYKLEKCETSEGRVLLQGNVAVALGKMLGGCRVQTYYPITPASDESEYLEAHEVLDLKVDDPPRGEEKYMESKGAVLVVQTEDEISAITMVIGAALTGARSSTSTSGPGFSLMVEGLGWAGMNEVPVVISYYQRAGPSTGLPTRHEQGDLKFVLNAGHGDFPRIVLASGDLEECFYDAIRAFNYAEKYQLPVIHLVDKALANTTMTQGLFDLNRVKIDRGKLLGEEELAKITATGGRYRRFALETSGISPRAVLGQKGGIFWNTGDEHDEYGHITEDSRMRIRMMDKRMGKLETASREIPDSEKANYLDGGGEMTLVSWGSPKGAILDALEMLKADGLKVNFLQIRLISPFPKEYVGRVLEGARVKVDVEMNYTAHLAGVVRQETGISMDHHVVKYTGRPMTTDEVYHSIKQIAKGDAPRRVVLSHGA